MKTDNKAVTPQSLRESAKRYRESAAYADSSQARQYDLKMARELEEQARQLEGGGGSRDQ